MSYSEEVIVHVTPEGECQLAHVETSEPIIVKPGEYYRINWGAGIHAKGFFKPPEVKKQEVAEAIAREEGDGPRQARTDRLVRRETGRRQA